MTVQATDQSSEAWKTVGWFCWSFSCACLPCMVCSTVTQNSERSICPGDSLLIGSALVDTGVTQNHGWSTVHHESTRDGVLHYQKINAGSVAGYTSVFYGWAFQARTDHNLLRWLHNFCDPVGQVARWLEILSEYNIQAIHRPGVQQTMLMLCFAAHAISVAVHTRKKWHPCHSIFLDASIVHRGDLCNSTTESWPPVSSAAVLTLHSTENSTGKYIPQNLVTSEGLPHTMWWHSIPAWGGAQPWLQLILPLLMVPKALRTS